MIVILFAFGFGTTGALRARKRGGNGLDMAQYFAAMFLAGAALGLIITVIIDRII